jgi:hypothetical protein
MLYIEWMHWSRIIRIDDDHQPETLATFDGDSVGRWEGDTLVVETINFMDQPYQPAERRVIEPKSDQVPYEYACHEGNYAMSATLRGARVREAEHRGAAN